MSVEFRIVSIGTLSSNPFWSEPPGVRTPHATTTLVRDGDKLILIDPSLPSPAIEARLFETTGLKPEQITDVFCTTLRPVHRRSIQVFSNARWMCYQEELAAYRGHLERLSHSSQRLEGQVERALEMDMKLIKRIEPAPERITPNVHLYPLKGASVGSAGLLVLGALRAVIVAGDAALTERHVMSGRVWSGSADVESATQSLAELIEIADIIVCGHDNYMLSPRFWMK